MRVYELKDFIICGILFLTGSGVMSLILKKEDAIGDIVGDALTILGVLACLWFLWGGYV